jgi:hypothetical protein
VKKGQGRLNGIQHIRLCSSSVSGILAGFLSLELGFWLLIEAILKAVSFTKLLAIKRDKTMFVSKNLKEAFEKSKETLEGFVQDISQVSQDIRLLELILKNYALHSPFHSLFAHGFKMIPGDENAKTDVEHHLYEFVSWEVNKKQKKSSFRLFYKKYEAHLLPNTEKSETADQFSSQIPKESKLIEKRPLIETLASTRLKIYPYLPTFLEKLAEELSKHKTKLDFTRFRQSIDEFEKKMKNKEKI